MRFSRVQINNFYNLKDVDLDLSSGSSLIVGPNGSGKSNIIKCVQGLVKLLTRNVQFPSGTWTVKESLDETFIKIRAGLNRKEADFLGRLHAMFISFDVIKVANMISQFILHTLRRDYSGDLDSVKATCKFVSVIPSGASDTLMSRVVNIDSDQLLNGKGILPEERILQICIEELYPKLVELACGNQNMVIGFSSSDVELFAMPMPPKSGEHVYSNRVREDFRKGLSLSENVKLPGDVAAMKKAVIEALNKIFYDSDIEGFGLDATFAGSAETPYHEVPTGEEISLVDAIGHLVQPKLLTYQFVRISIYSKNSERMIGRVGSDSLSDMDMGVDDRNLQHYETFWRNLQILLDNLNSTRLRNISCSNLRILSQNDNGVRSLLRKFLKGSLCILPQDRGIFSETDDWTLSLSAVESQLITWKLR